MKIFSIIFSLVIISYLFILNGDFLGDDIDRIVFNFELNSYWKALTGNLADRPLLMLWITTIRKVFGIESVYFRFFSVLIHSVVAYQIYIFLKELNKDIFSPQKEYIFIFISALFALHPLNNQSITTSIQSGVLLAGLFGIISIRFFYKGIKEINSKNYYVSFGSLLLGVLAKPILSFIPLFYIVNFKKIEGSFLKRFIILASYFSILGIPAMYYFLLTKNVQKSALSPLGYFLVQSEVIFTYFKLMIMPYGLHFLYDFSTPIDMLWNRNWLFVLLHAVAIALAIRYIKDKLLIILFVGFYLSFIPESSFFPIHHLAFEHRTYFPMIFLFIFLGSFVIRLNLKKHFEKTLKIIFVGVCGLYLILNQSRNLEIKTYGGWLINTLEYSMMYHYNNFLFNFLLMRSGNLNEVEPFLTKYKQVYKNDGYENLSLIHDYYSHQNKKQEYLKVFCELLNRSNLDNNSRYFISKIVIEEFAHKSDSVEELALIEKTFSYQIKYMVNDRDLFTSLMTNYSNLANFLISPHYLDKFKKNDYENYLKTKAVLFYYFNQQFPELIEEIDKALLENPRSLVLQDIKFKVKNKK